ncbi:MAG: HAD-IA family hydrolase, partial [Oscillospiraceae bacterium]|nr:HAD-IA family hydrolase [Oscillospiraceae bacterium]
ANPDDFIPFQGTGDENYLGKVAELHGGTYCKEMKSRFYELYAAPENAALVRLPGVKDMILTVKNKGYKIAVASAADAPKVYTNIRFIGFSPDDFDTVITGNDVKKQKPAPDIYLAAAEKIGVPPEKCIVVEDAVAGVAAGKSAGAFTVGILGSFSKQALLDVGADRIIEKAADLANIIDSL